MTGPHFHFLSLEFIPQQFPWWYLPAFIFSLGCSGLVWGRGGGVTGGGDVGCGVRGGGVVEEGARGRGA